MHFPTEVMDTMLPDGTRVAIYVWALSNGEQLLGRLKHDYTLAAVKYWFERPFRFIRSPALCQHSRRHIQPILTLVQ